MNLLQLLNAGGVTIYVLILCSIVSLTVIIERYMYYRSRSRVKRAAFMHEIQEALKKGSIKQALKVCDETNTVFSNVVYSGLSFYGRAEKEISNNMERTITIETNLLEKRTAIVGTIGSTAVYIGLFGTVLGIIRAFKDIAVNASSGGLGGINVVINGISESLICTAAGLLVAVPAVMAYNYFTKKIDDFISDMELCASETMDIVAVKQKLI